MKPKATTLQERFGFRDSELSTPEHDAIILWLIRNKAWVARYLMPQPRVDWDDRISKETAFAALPSDWKVSDELKPQAITEFAIKSGAFVIGFIDLVVSRSSWWVYRDGASAKATPSLSGDESFAIEVKPKITSFGETMRQIRHYQAYDRTPFAICTPDQRFREAFEEQGVKCFWIDDVKTLAAEYCLANALLEEATDGTRPQH